MLVLTRKSEQKIIIGKDIVITILKVQGDQVSIGIHAPHDVSIYREEVLSAIREENAVGAVSSSNNVDVRTVAKSLKNLKGMKGSNQNIARLSQNRKSISNYQNSNRKLPRQDSGRPENVRQDSLRKDIVRKESSMKDFTKKKDLENEQPDSKLSRSKLLSSKEKLKQNKEETS